MNKVLKASAGTGKTYRLSLEYVLALLEGRSFTEIVVMTFTRKATAEIRDRILDHIEELLTEGEDSQVFASLREIEPELSFSPRRLDRVYKRMLRNKDSIHVYTIDSFTNRIFRRAIAPYMGIYGYEIVDEEKNREIYREVLARLLDSRRDFELLEEFLVDRGERDIKKYVDLIAKVVHNRWKFLLIEYSRREKPEVDELSHCLEECIRVLNDIVQEKGSEFSADFLVKPFKDMLPDYLTLKDRGEKRRLILKSCSDFIDKTFWHGGKVRGKAVAELREEMEARYENFRAQLAAHIFGEEMIPYEERIFNFSQRTFRLYDRIKYREKKFTHTDISNYTYRYLRESELGLVENGEVSDHFFELVEAEVKSLFIDEFQDTSILQWKILQPLMERCQEVIAVGDEKQSIYGWRGGEKELFSRLDRILGGKSESLDICYRSEREIINFVNGFFSGLDVDWDYSPVENLPKKNEGYVEVLLGGEKAPVNTDTKSFRKKSAEKQQEIEELNRKIVKDLKGRLVDKIKGLPSFSGVGVLARTSRELAEIALRLEAEDIPYILENRDCLLEHRAVKYLYSLCRYLNYGDYFSLLEFLWSGLGETDSRSFKKLLLNREQIENFLSVCTASGEDLSPEEEIKEKVREGLMDELELSRRIVSQLSAVRNMREMDYDRLTEYLFRESGIIREYCDDAGALRNFFKFFRLMRRFGCLADFMEHVRENRESEELKQVEVVEGDAVQLMTIHKSKGLSFSTEFFYWSPGGGGGYGGDKMEFFLEFDDLFAEVEDYLLTSSGYEKYFPFLGFDFADQRDWKALMEEINNVYVAMTRAEKNLYVFIESPRTLRPNKDRCWQSSDTYGFYEPALLDATAVVHLCDLVEGYSSGELVVEEEVEEEGEKAEVPALAPYLQTASLSTEKLEKNYDRTLAGEVERSRGLALHYFLQHIKYGTSREKEYARRVTFSRFGNVLGKERMEAICRQAENFVEENPEYFSRRWQIFTEYELRDGDQFQRIDRLLVDEKEKEILILDYKSGYTREDSQLEEYRKLIEKYCGDEYLVRTRFVDI
ncbi:MAG: UvrD-helicase domain-containing protein [Halanaerobiaceae bacterium]